MAGPNIILPNGMERINLIQIVVPMYRPNVPAQEGNEKENKPAIPAGGGLIVNLPVPTNTTEQALVAIGSLLTNILAELAEARAERHNDRILAAIKASPPNREQRRHPTSNGNATQ